jgi:hypothetical protein
MWYAGVMELVDIADLKSASLNKGVPVRVRPSAFPNKVGKIPNHKLQTPNNLQYPIFKRRLDDTKFGYYNFDIVCELMFGFCYLEKSFIFISFYSIE